MELITVIEKNWNSLINTDIIEVKTNNNNPSSATVTVATGSAATAPKSNAT